MNSMLGVHVCMCVCMHTAIRRDLLYWLTTVVSGSIFGGRGIQLVGVAGKDITLPSRKGGWRSTERFSNACLSICSPNNMLCLTIIRLLGNRIGLVIWCGFKGHGFHHGESEAYLYVVYLTTSIDDTNPQHHTHHKHWYANGGIQWTYKRTSKGHWIMISIKDSMLSSPRQLLRRLDGWMDT